MANVTVSAGVLAGTYTGGEATLEMRILVSENFTASDNVNLMKSVLEQGDFYQSVTCSVSLGVVSYPAFVIKSTTDAIANPDRAKYVFALYTVTGQFVQNVAKRIKVPVLPNPTTIGLLILYSQTLVDGSLGGTDFYTKAEIDAILATDIAAAIAALINGAPGSLDTLNELAAALGNDANFATTVTAALVPTGGATGQALVKTSNVNYAMAWQSIALTIASQAEAEAGLENTKVMTALRVAQAIAAYLNATDGGFLFIGGPGNSSPTAFLGADGDSYISPGDGTIYLRVAGTWGAVARIVPAGGSTGQALVKTSNADFVVAWGDVASPLGGDLSGTTDAAVVARIQNRTLTLPVAAVFADEFPGSSLDLAKWTTPAGDADAYITAVVASGRLKFYTVNNTFYKGKYIFSQTTFNVTGKYIEFKIPTISPTPPSGQINHWFGYMNSGTAAASGSGQTTPVDFIGFQIQTVAGNVGIKIHFIEPTNGNNITGSAPITDGTPLRLRLREAAGVMYYDAMYTEGVWTVVYTHDYAIAALANKKVYIHASGEQNLVQGIEIDYVRSDLAVSDALTNGDVLTWNSALAAFVNAAPTAGVLVLDNLLDVVITTPATGAVLTYDGTNWIDALPSSGGASYTAAFTHTTASMVNAASVTETMLNLGKSISLSKITVNKVARVRIYRNAAFATADLARAVGVAPADGHGLAYEHVFATGDLARWVANPPTIINAESPRTDDFAVIVTNLSGATGTVQIDLQFLVIEP